LSAEDEFLLLVIKLRQCKEDLELSFMFGIGTTAVAKTFRTWLSFLYFHFREMDLWLPRNLVDQFMPSDVRELYPSTRVIIDGTEIPIAKPSNPIDQSASFSTYKNKNTVKVLVGISPKGVITYISDAYGGSASDRQIVECGDLLSEGIFEKGDSILSDRGFVVKDLFCPKEVSINMPSFLRGQNQLDAKTVVYDRRIASKRIHVERCIGLAKTYKILKRELNAKYVPIAGRIIFVCFALTNFKPCIVGK